MAFDCLGVRGVVGVCANRKRKLTKSLTLRNPSILSSQGFVFPLVLAEGLKKYLGVVSKLAYDEKPDYSQLRQFLRSGTNSEWVLGLAAEGLSLIHI